MERHFYFVRNLCFVITVMVLLTATSIRGQGGTSSQCLSYGAACSRGTDMCCFNPMVTCLANRREEMSCLSPFDITNLSPSLASSPLYQGITNATRRLLNLLPGLSSRLGSDISTTYG